MQMLKNNNTKLCKTDISCASRSRYCVGLLDLSEKVSQKKKIYFS